MPSDGEDRHSVRKSGDALAFPGALSSLTRDLIRDTPASSRQSWEGLLKRPSLVPTERSRARQRRRAQVMASSTGGRRHGCPSWSPAGVGGAQPLSQCEKSSATRRTVSALGSAQASPTLLAGGCHPCWLLTAASQLGEGLPSALETCFVQSLRTRASPGFKASHGLALVTWATYVTSLNPAPFSKAG